MAQDGSKWRDRAVITDGEWFRQSANIAACRACNRVVKYGAPNPNGLPVSFADLLTGCEPARYRGLCKARDIAACGASYENILHAVRALLVRMAHPIRGTNTQGCLSA